MNPKSTDCEADALTTTPSRRCAFNYITFNHCEFDLNKSTKDLELQYTTQRVYSKRDLFETLTSMNIARDHHNRIIH